jgi:hypothetical protein
MVLVLSEDVAIANETLATSNKNSRILNKNHPVSIETIPISGKTAARLDVKFPERMGISLFIKILPQLSNHSND